MTMIDIAKPLQKNAHEMEIVFAKGFNEKVSWWPGVIK